MNAYSTNYWYLLLSFEMKNVVTDTPRAHVIIYIHFASTCTLLYIIHFNT